MSGFWTCNIPCSRFSYPLVYALNLVEEKQILLKEQGMFAGQSPAAVLGPLPEMTCCEVFTFKI